MIAKPLLSICMIVKDESALLPGCLESLAAIPAELIVVDTGSSDDTVEIAKKFGASVFHFTWINDFAAARNYSIAQANLPWILWLDADERLDSGSIVQLKRLLVPAANPTGYRVSINNLQSDQKSATLSTAFRLISNHPTTSFRGIVHEQPHDSIKEHKGRLLDSDIVLNHLGYSLPPEQLSQKQARNRLLLKQMVAESPDSAYAWYTYGQNYALEGDYREAVTAYEKAEELGQFESFALASLMNVMAEAYLRTGAVDKARSCTGRSLELTARQVGGHFNQYRIHKASENLIGQIEALENILHLPMKNAVFTGDLPQDISIPREQVLFSLGELYLATEQPAVAARHLEACLQAQPDNQPALKLAAAAYGQLMEWNKLVSILDRLDQPLSDQYKEMLSIGLIKLERWDKAIEFHETWLQAEPENQNLRQRLAGIYGKAGNAEMMRKLLGQLENR